MTTKTIDPPPLPNPQSDRQRSAPAAHEARGRGNRNGSSIPAQPAMLRTGVAMSDSSIGVDRERNVIFGYVLTEAGDFKDKRDATDVRIADVSSQLATLAASTRLLWCSRDHS